MNFINDFETDEQIISTVWTIEVQEGVDPNPKIHLEGTAAAYVPKDSSLKIGSMQRVGGLWPSVNYRVTAIVVTDQGNTRNLWSHIRGVRGDSG